MKIRNWFLPMIAAAATFAGGQANAVPVGLELMLLVDVSGSVTTQEYNLQNQGYVQAFQSAAVQNAILNSQGGSIAVTYIEWSGNNQQFQQVNWALINSAASANAFAATLSGVIRASSGSTAIQDAIGKQYVLFGSEVGGSGNGFESTRQVIDVSGDGADNNSVTFSANGGGRNAALLAGVDTINGIAILGEAGLATYYNTFVKGGTNGFVSIANNFGSFGTAIQAKLIREVSDVPEPTTVALFGLGLAGLFVCGQRRRKASGKPL